MPGHMRRLATFTEQGELDDAAIFVRGNVVEWVGRDAELPAALSAADAVLELRDHVMIPGMSGRHPFWLGGGLAEGRSIALRFRVCCMIAGQAMRGVMLLLSGADGFKRLSCQCQRLHHRAT